MMASSSSSSGHRKYDVFLSFRGEDTRKIFVGHLYRALQQKAINTFIDSEELSKGNKISELLTAIEDSRISIVVLSQNYATSTWCLKELVKILDCMDTKKQIVVPIFYEVDPSHLRKINGKFAEAFAKHGENPNLDKEELKSWRSALTAIADLSGWDSSKYEDDGKLIEEIVENTLKKLIHTSSNKANGLVGMDSHIRKMNSILGLQVNDVRVVGIWGMGGIGKTTIARAVYDEIACQFEHSCFLYNVKEAFINKHQVQLQEELLSRLLEENVRSVNLDRGWNMIMKRLGTKKVLVVLDDVETFTQIEALLGNLHAFGEGSRIVVTTRNKQLLSGVDETYQPMCLGDDKSLELFMKYAFRTNQPNGDYDHLSRRAVEYAQGLPLALKVLGAFLDNKSVCEWEAVLEKLKKTSHIEIQDVLRTSFDGLDDTEKEIFLDIACLFREWGKDFVTKLLDSCGFFAHNGLRVLVDRALITTEHNKLDMHDLIQHMGREVVRLESTKEPGKRSRLWSYEDVDHVLTQNKATDAVECLMLNLSNLKVDLCINTEAFVRMTKLRLLIIYYSFNSIFDPGHCCTWRTSCETICLVDGCKFLSHELRFLLWHGCPLKSLPSTFIPKNLVRLDMRGSQIRVLWEGIKPLQNLKAIMLGYCQYLVKIPDLTEAINLEELRLNGCSRLLEIHPSIFALQHLVILDLDSCKQLKILPSSIHMKSLKILNATCCWNLEKFSEISPVMNELRDLHLRGTAIKELPSSINNLAGLVILDLRGCREFKSLNGSIYMKSLHTLNLSGCSNLEKFPEISEVMTELRDLHLRGTAIKELPSSINNLAGLVILDLRGCREFKSLPSSIYMKSLHTLNLSGCSNLEKFPEISEVMTELKKLYLDGTAIKELSSSINNLTGLVTLCLANCKELKTLSTSIRMSSLHTLDLYGCSNLEKFPEISGIMKELPELSLDDTAIKELPSSIDLLLGVNKLSIRNCKSLEFLPDSICNLAELTHLDLTGCTELKTLSTSIHMSSLQILNLYGCSKLEKFPEISGIMKELSELHLDWSAIKGLPSSIDLFRGIKKVTMRNCKSLVFLPDSIYNLADLTHLDLSGCSALHNLPEKLGDLESLHALDVRDSGIKLLPFSILRLGKLTGDRLSCIGCKEMTAPLSTWPSSMEEYCSYSFLLHLDLSDCNLLELSDGIAHLSSLKTLNLSRNNLESLPVTMNLLGCLTHLELEACKRLKSIPELLSIHYINAHYCTALETVSTPKSRDLDFRFSNCFQLVEANLFRDIVETHSLDQDNHLRPLCFNICLPGSEVPEWFNLRDLGCSVTFHVPLNSFNNKLLGFAICIVINFNGACHDVSNMYGRCYWTSKKGKRGDYSFKIDLLSRQFRIYSLESDHLFMAYLPWSGYGRISQDRLNAFKIVVETGTYFPTEDCFTSSCGVRLVYANHVDEGCCAAGGGLLC